MNKKIIVTGGCGYIGLHTIVELIEAGFEPVSIDSNVNSKEESLDGVFKITGKKIKNYKIDLSDKSKTNEVFREIGEVFGVIHFAALKFVGESGEKPLLYYKNNLISLLNVLDLVKEQNIPNFIFSSSCTVYGNPDKLPVDENTPVKKAESVYGATKQISEQIIADASKTQNTHFTILRYFNPAGAHLTALIGDNHEGNFQLIPYICQVASGKKEKLVVFGKDYPTRDGTCVRDYLHVCDLAKAHIAPLEKVINSKLEVFNLGFGKGQTVLEMINAFEKVTGVKLNWEYGPRREGDVIEVYSNSSKAEKLLNWKPQYSLEDIMKTAWEWEKKLK